MDFRLLGPLEVESGGSSVPLAGPRERAVLAALLLHANRLVTRDRLVDDLWGDRPPLSARHTLEAYVSRLRRALSSGGDGGRIESEPGGYRIRVAANELDVLRFEELVASGRDALAGDVAVDAEKQLAAALDLWRGEPLADVSIAPFAAGEAARLTELRLSAVEARSTALLALGRHADVVRELGPLVAEHPFREALRGLLMLALYRSGRQADSLATYLEGRRRLVDELGIEPGSELEELQQAILRHDPVLDASAIAGRAASRSEAGGSSTVPLLRARERRKTVTVVACELEESTALAQRLDPEALERVLAQYVEALGAIVARHGGTIEASLGDRLMALFGVPLLHEDDALRACRAALEMRAEARRHGVRSRIGIASGEVIAGSVGATGAPVQLATRLAQAARPDEILLRRETVQLLGPLIDVARRGERASAAGGSTGEVLRLRRLAALAEPALTPFAGRTRELALLESALRRAVEERELHLFTLLGPAGIGKSRLVREFQATLGRAAQVVSGRCLSYGQAITYWPLVEILRALGRPARLALERVVAGGAVSPAELASVVQGALEQAAAIRPLLVVVEDLHWAEPALLDLLDSVAERSRGVPILLLGVARPELLEQRPNWAAGRFNAATVLLEPLSGADSAVLLAAQAGSLSPVERERILRIAAGNPLFIEELTSFASEGGGDELPPRIQALLQARLDRLPEEERLLLCCAAVEGTVFHEAALETLLFDPRVDHERALAALTRKLLIRSAPGELEGERAFRFRHQLIRDAAYAAIPKADRARLHERFATWLERHAGDRGELADIAAYHLEQGAVARRELGAPDAALNARAAEHLAAAAGRASRRTDLRGAVGLWRRALALLDAEDRRAAGVELELAEVLTRLGRRDQALELLESAGRSSDVAVGAAVRIALLRGRLFSDPEAPAAARAACAEAIPVFEAGGDHGSLARAWHTLAMAERAEMQLAAAARAYAKAAEHAHILGDRAFEAFELGLRTTMLAESNLPYAIGLRELEPIAARFPGEPFIEPMLVGLRGFAAFHAGRRGRARPMIRDCITGLRQAGYAPVAGGVTVRTARLELLAGNLDEAERLVLATIDEQREIDLGFLGHAKAVLSEIRVAQGRDREALQLAGEAETSGGPDRRMAFVVANCAKARAWAHLGEIHQARSAADTAVAIATASESLDAQARAQSALAEVLEAAEDLTAALAAAEEAGRAYTSLDRPLERRQINRLASRIKRRLWALPGGAPRDRRSARRGVPSRCHRRRARPDTIA